MPQGHCLQDVAQRSFKCEKRSRTAEVSAEGVKNRGSTIVNPEVQAVAMLAEVPSEQAGIAQALLIQRGVWSAGAEKHVEGACKPCRFVCTAKGCVSGKECAFCHLPHVRVVKSGNRPCKEKRAYCRKIRGIVDDMIEHRPDQKVHVHNIVSCQSYYMQNIFQNQQMPHMEQNTGQEGQCPCSKPVVCRDVKPQSSMSCIRLTQSQMLMDADKKEHRLCELACQMTETPDAVASSKPQRVYNLIDL